MATIAGLRKRSADLLNKLAGAIYSPDATTGNEIYDIGKEKLNPNSKRALVIYVLFAVRYYVKSEIEKFPYLTAHSMWQESIEIVEALNEAGYIVDYFDVYSEHKIDWHKYDLIIDERNSLTSSPQIAGQKKIYYSTGTYWLNHNLAELTRIKQFYERNGIVLPSKRQVNPNFSDLHADYLTYFGNESQLSVFSDKCKKHPLNISAFVPSFQKKNIDYSRNKFLWIGSGGMLHKGLDLTIEAFVKMQDNELFIAGNIDSEPLFAEWCKGIMKERSNIHYLGWMDIASEDFKKVANNCIGIIYPSCSEGGPGAVAQALHFGLIPIVTSQSNVRGEHLGRIISSDNDLEIINEIIEHVNEIKNLTENELTLLIDNVREFALTTHTVAKYKESFQSLINLIK